MADATHNIAPAAFTASLAAGPVAVGLFGLGNLTSGDEVTIWIDEQRGPMMGSLAIAGFFAALIVAIVPNLIGTMVMGWLGARNVGLRHPAIWGMAGAAIMAFPLWLSADIGQPMPENYIAFWAGIGAISALICRRGIKWGAA